MKKFESAKAQWPRSRPVRSGGVRISGRYMPPGRAGALPRLYGLIVFVQCAMILADTGSPAAVAVWAALMALLYLVLWKRALTDMLSKFLDVRVFSDRIEVQGNLFRKKYCRSNPVAFQIEPHHRGADEALKTGRAQEGAYRFAVEVVMQYGERRIVIAEMPHSGIEHAEALLTRLREAMAATEAETSTAAASSEPMQRRYSPYSSAAHLYG